MRSSKVLTQRSADCCTHRQKKKTESQQHMTMTKLITALQPWCTVKKAIRLLIEEKIFSNISLWNEVTYKHICRAEQWGKTYLHFDSTTADGTNSFPNKVYIHFSGILFQFSQYLRRNQHHFKWISIEINCTSEMKGWMGFMGKKWVCCNLYLAYSYKKDSIK